MKIISVSNFKGGVGKTSSAINIAYILSKRGNKVLLIDNDKQGNASQFFGLYDYAEPSISDVLTARGYDIEKAIKPTKYENLDVLPANMNLLRANKEILLDVSRPQQTRLAKALHRLSVEYHEERYDYDFVIIDNAPDLNMSVINALVASNDILIPIKVDKFAFDGLEHLIEQVEELRDFNDSLRIAGAFITMFQNNNINNQGNEYLNTSLNIPVFKTLIRSTVRVSESTFTGVPLPIYAKNCTAAVDYQALVDEYLNCARN